MISFPHYDSSFLIAWYSIFIVSPLLFYWRRWPAQPCQNISRWSRSSRRAGFSRDNGALVCVSAIKTWETVSSARGIMQNIWLFLLNVSKMHYIEYSTLIFWTFIRSYILCTLSWPAVYVCVCVYSGCFALCCLPVFTCKVTSAVGACPCLPLLDCIGCVSPASLAMRASVRERFGIQVVHDNNKKITQNYYIVSSNILNPTYFWVGLLDWT